MDALSILWFDGCRLVGCQLGVSSGYFNLTVFCIRRINEGL